MGKQNRKLYPLGLRKVPVILSTYFDPMYINEKHGEFGEKYLGPDLLKTEVILIFVHLKWEQSVQSLRLDQVVCKKKKKSLKKYVHVKRMSRMIQPFYFLFFCKWVMSVFAFLLFAFPFSLRTQIFVGFFFLSLLGMDQIFTTFKDCYNEKKKLCLIIMSVLFMALILIFKKLAICPMTIYWMKRRNQEWRDKSQTISF